MNSAFPFFWCKTRRPFQLCRMQRNTTSAKAHNAVSETWSANYGSRFENSVEPRKTERGMHRRSPFSLENKKQSSRYVRMRRRIVRVVASTSTGWPHRTSLQHAADLRSGTDHPYHCGRSSWFSVGLAARAKGKPGGAEGVHRGAGFSGHICPKFSLLFSDCEGSQFGQPFTMLDLHHFT